MTIGVKIVMVTLLLIMMIIAGDNDHNWVAMRVTIIAR
jgi:hypothetical protein